MAKEREIECKNIVSKEEFHELLSHFNISEKDFFRQTNYYFDTPGFSLKELRSALRLRKLEERSEITLKIPADVGLFEINQAADKKETTALLENSVLPEGEIKEELIKKEVPTHQLSCFGSLETNRAEIQYKNGLLVFDHSRYLGREDYEVEYEVTDWESGQEIFHTLLKKFNIKREQADNKVERFYRAKLDGSSNT